MRGNKGTLGANKRPFFRSDFLIPDFPLDIGPAAVGPFLCGGSAATIRLIIQCHWSVLSQNAVLKPRVSEKSLSPIASMFGGRVPFGM